MEMPRSPINSIQNHIDLTHALSPVRYGLLEAIRMGATLFAIGVVSSVVFNAPGLALFLAPFIVLVAMPLAFLDGCSATRGISGGRSRLFSLNGEDVSIDSHSLTWHGKARECKYFVGWTNDDPTCSLGISLPAIILCWPNFHATSRSICALGRTQIVTTDKALADSGAVKLSTRPRLRAITEESVGFAGGVVCALLLVQVLRIVDVAYEVCTFHWFSAPLSGWIIGKLLAEMFRRQGRGDVVILGGNPRDFFYKMAKAMFSGMIGFRAGAAAPIDTGVIATSIVVVTVEAVGVAMAYAVLKGRDKKNLRRFSELPGAMSALQNRADM